MKNICSKVIDMKNIYFAWNRTDEYKGQDFYNAGEKMMATVMLMSVVMKMMMLMMMARGTSSLATIISITICMTQG